MENDRCTCNNNNEFCNDCGLTTICQIGPTGAQGETGPTGPTGYTGDTGIIVTDNNAALGNAGTQIVNTNAAVTFINNYVLNGTAITYALPTTDILLDGSQTYLVSYKTMANTTTGDTIRLTLYLNGSVIPGGTIFDDNVAANEYAPISGSFLVDVPAGGGTLQLRNTGATQVNINGVYVSIVKLI
ncbi:hypothetical protein QOZ83_16650 [Romboutsia sedimentorum]|uniref:hypothetical protein n=1 Tax=Romboutsia sedimentorum TaxID=1368474 RepID=UPI0024DEE45E|nr:hypothetical protein [Romboutsia sedimentorum]MDK2587471.1 hypothetical protein [Romboutsia sedimentorum]